MQFGSKIDAKEQKRDDLFTVKNVLCANKIELNNGLIVQLLGIQPNPEFENQAIEFLKEKFKKRKVFLKYDSVKYDSKNNLLCYVYLDNKTFVNNHLIRTGFVSVDESFDYKYKKKFLEAKNG